MAQKAHFTARAKWQFVAGEVQIQVFVIWILFLKLLPLMFSNR